MALLPQDYAVIKQMITAQAVEWRKPSAGLVRRGQVKGYNPISKIAQVRMDDALTDEEQIDVENITSDLLTVGMYVHVLFQDPSGAYVVGTASTVSAAGVSFTGTVTVPDGGGGVTVPTTGGGMSVDIDTHGYCAGSTGLFTIPTGLAGVYVMTMTVNVGAVNPTRLFAQWETGGVIWRNTAGAVASPSGPPIIVDQVATVTATLLLDVGTVMTPGIYQVSGASRSTGVHVHFWLLQQTPEL